jgi:hypothetical protein
MGRHFPQKNLELVDGPCRGAPGNPHGLIDLVGREELTLTLGAEEEDHRGLQGVSTCLVHGGYPVTQFLTPRLSRVGGGGTISLPSTASVTILNASSGTIAEWSFSTEGWSVSPSTTFERSDQFVFDSGVAVDVDRGGWFYASATGAGAGDGRLPSST